jgi:hypothetical protein
MIVIRMDGPLADEYTANRVEEAFEGLPFRQVLIFERDEATKTDRPHFQVRGPRRLLMREQFTGPAIHGEMVHGTIARILLEQTIGYPVEVVCTEEWLTQTTHPFPVF